MNEVESDVDRKSGRTIHMPFVVTAFMRPEAASDRFDPMNQGTTSPGE